MATIFPPRRRYRPAPALLATTAAIRQEYLAAATLAGIFGLIGLRALVGMREQHARGIYSIRPAQAEAETSPQAPTVQPSDASA